MIHIHNGDLLLSAARRTAIPGEHVAFREALVTGPIRPGDEWIESRARHLAGSHGDDLLRVRTALLEQELLLDGAPQRGEVVLWFEHDLFCLIHLLYLLQRLATASVSMVWAATPIAERDERELHLLFESREAVPPSIRTLAAAAWSAFASGDPLELNRFLAEDRSELPFLGEGLALHASRFPSTRNGLGVVEQRALELIAGGTGDFTSLFDAINAQVPRLGFGDREILRHLQQLATCAVPLVTIAGEAPKVILAVTPAGENVLGGAVDNVTINDPDQWLGGAHLTRTSLWRWDGARIVRGS